MTHRLTLSILSASTLWLSLPAQAEGLARCRALADAPARLACYDALADAARPATTGALASPPASSVASATPPAATAIARFGLPARVTGAEPEAIDSTLPGEFEGWGPDSQLRLANGQVWQVIDGSSAAVAMRDPAVRVVRGVLGGYRLEVQGLNRSPRVRRLK